MLTTQTFGLNLWGCGCFLMNAGDFPLPQQQANFVQGKPKAPDWGMQQFVIIPGPPDISPSAHNINTLRESHIHTCRDKGSLQRGCFPFCCVTISCFCEKWHRGSPGWKRATSRELSRYVDKFASWVFGHLYVNMMNTWFWFRKSSQVPPSALKII